jgi:hypothetical protein
MTGGPRSYGTGRRAPAVTLACAERLPLCQFRVSQGVTAPCVTAPCVTAPCVTAPCDTAPETCRRSRVSVRRLVADDTHRQHDVTRPAARAAEAHEHAILPGPVLGHKAPAAFGQRQRRRAPRAIPRRVPPVPLRVQRKPAPVNVGANRSISLSANWSISSSANRGPSWRPGGRPVAGRDHGHSAAAFLFSCALMCSFFSASACGLNREDARSMNSMANDPPASNLFFSHGRSIRER